MDALLGDPVLARRDIERRVARGAPDPGLPTASSYLQADLVVAGKHSGSRIGDAVMGSLSRFPAYYTACDVLEVCHTATNRHRLLSAHCMGGRNVPATCANDSHHSTRYRRANLRLPTLDRLVGIGESKYPSSCPHRPRDPLSDRCDGSKVFWALTSSMTSYWDMLGINFPSGFRASMRPEVDLPGARRLLGERGYARPTRPHADARAEGGALTQ